jgi:type IV pilus assembly protein PilW
MKALKNTVQKGFTLIEIMIALTIGLFLAAGAAQVFIGTKQTNRTQENLSRMQENARFAMYFLTKDIRNVAFDGGVCGRGKIINNAINDLDSSSAEYQFKTLPIFSSLSGAIGGTDNTGLNGSDSISIRAFGSLGSGVKLINPLALVSDDLQINASEAGRFLQGDIILVTDCKFSDIVQITSNPAGGTLVHATGSAETPDNKTGNLSFAYGTNAKVYHLAAGTTGLAGTTYTIANSVSTPGLARGGQQLVPDIENMQILYGQLDASNSNGIYFVPAGTAGLDMEQVISVRVRLLVRSRDDFVAQHHKPIFIILMAHRRRRRTTD